VLTYGSFSHKKKRRAEELSERQVILLKTKQIDVCLRKSAASPQEAQPGSRVERSITVMSWQLAFIKFERRQQVAISEYLNHGQWLQKTSAASSWYCSCCCGRARLRQRHATSHIPSNSAPFVGCYTTIRPGTTCRGGKYLTIVPTAKDSDGRIHWMQHCSQLPDPPLSPPPRRIRKSRLEFSSGTGTPRISKSSPPFARQQPKGVSNV